LPLPAAKLSRETTLYQCGWAAAEAHFRGARSRGAWIWQASSGVLAASVVVLGVLLVKQDAAQQAASPPSGDGSYARQSVVVERAPATRAIAEARPLPVVDFAVRFAPDDSSMLAVRERALRGILPESAKTADQGEAQYREPKTHRELLDEFIERNIHS
jgi:hypothetical protein